MRHVAALALLVLAGLTACGGGSAPAATGPTGTPAAAVTGSSEPSPTSAAPTTGPASGGLTCQQIGTATLGSATVPYQGMDAPLHLFEGSWTDEAGNLAEVKVCAVGDLDGDAAVDAMAAVEFTPADGGTGRFWTLAVWHNANGSPTFVALADLGDRNPVQSIAISGAVATVVWLTRGPDDPDAVVTIRRTSTFTLAGASLTETSHVDAPYSAS